MNPAYQMLVPAIAGMLLTPQLVAATFPGRPLLLSAEGAGQNAAWVAYENGDVLRCQADTATCKAMTGLPTFSSPVSLSAELGHPAAWVGWSDGALYRCDDKGHCKVMTMPTDAVSGQRVR